MPLAVLRVFCVFKFSGWPQEIHQLEEEEEEEEEAVEVAVEVGGVVVVAAVSSQTIYIVSSL